MVLTAFTISLCTNSAYDYVFAVSVMTQLKANCL